MTVLRAAGVGRRYGPRDVLRDVTLQIEDGDKIGVIGVNGGGKTTLLRLLIGAEQPTVGSVWREPNLRIGYVPQHVHSTAAATPRAFLLQPWHDASARLRAAEARLAQTHRAELSKAMRAYQTARDDYDRIDGDHYEARAERLLGVFGLHDKQAQPVASLSGGEQNLLALANALLIRPDLLVLDEPANHLDYIGQAWLEQFLARFKGTVIMVSHNRYLLDRVVTGIVEIEHGVLTRYRGNYSAFSEQKLRARIGQEHAHQAYQRRLERLQALVQRFADLARVHSSWGARYRARLSQLTHLQEQAVAAPTHAPRRAAMRFNTGATQANIVLRVNNYRKAYGARVLLQGVSFDITSGERVALVGPNGCGKTSLLRDILAHGHWHDDTIRIGPSISLGYCAQQQEVLHPERTLEQELMSAGAGSRQEALDLLARFLFRGDDVAKRVADLSGGERNRLQLARLMLINPNFMILDEPTNHLDIQTCEAVEEALDDYRGTLLVVSHDRYFLENVVERVLEVRDGTIASYPGTYSEFWAQRSARDEATAAPSAPDEHAAQPARRITAAVPQSAPRRSAAKELAALEQTIQQCEQAKDAAEREAATAYAAGEHARGNELMQRVRALEQDITSHYKRWLAQQS
jgi:ATP-binding cassette subfamily F protein 3